LLTLTIEENIDAIVTAKISVLEALKVLLLSRAVREFPVQVI